MTSPLMNWSETNVFRVAGLLYAAIILLALGAEIGLRQPVVGAADPLSALAANRHILPFSILADSLMIVADVVLAALLFSLLSSVDRGLSALAALFRLLQAAVLAGNLIHLQHAALLLADGDSAVALRSLNLHAAGYDLGLVFFGFSSILTGILIGRHPAFPVWLGGLVIVTGGIYLTGTTLRITDPDLGGLFQPAYLVAIVSETAFALVLLKRGFFPTRRETSRRRDAGPARSGQVLVGDEGFEPPTSSM